MDEEYPAPYLDRIFGVIPRVSRYSAASFFLRKAVNVSWANVRQICRASRSFVFFRSSSVSSRSGTVMLYFEATSFTASKKDIPSCSFTKVITFPPLPHPKHFQIFLAGDTTRLASLSPWNGQTPL